jgi:hypothetical protein
MVQNAPVIENILKEAALLRVLTLYGLSARARKKKKTDAALLR